MGRHRLKLLNRGVFQAGIGLHQHSADNDCTECWNQNGGHCLAGPTTLHLRMIGGGKGGGYTTFGGNAPSDGRNGAIERGGGPIAGSAL